MPLPLATLAATVTAAGISAPTYSEIYESLQASFQSIYGSDAYIAPDSQDGQMLAVFAKAIDDCNSMAIAVYNNYSPATSQGAGLSTAVKMNGLERRAATYSTAAVRVVGVANTAINNGIISDVNGEHQWALPALVTIPVAGQIDVTATCSDLGDVEAAAATLTKIVTPTLGWQTVTNTAAAVAGDPVETDAALRRRQTTAAALPSVSALDAVVSGLRDIVGVTQVSVHENYTDATDAQLVPEHSIAAIVVGGADADIASSIALKKSPGCNTFGTTSVLTSDVNGLPITIRFSRPVEVAVPIVVNVEPLARYSTDVEAAIIAALEAYLEGLLIGETLYFNRLWVPANLAGTANSGTFQIVSMTAAGGTADIAANYNQRIVAGAVTVNQV